MLDLPNKVAHPLTAMQSVMHQADKWAGEWSVGKPYTHPSWPSTPNNDVEPVEVQDLITAAGTFPTEVGLGWDALHPRALLRLSGDAMHLLMMICRLCEQLGSWPLSIQFVIIVLLPKLDGGFRPI